MAPRAGRGGKTKTAMWWVGTALFTVLALSRLSGWEATLQSELRESLFADGTYADRRATQAPLIAGLILLVAGLLALSIFRSGRLPLHIRAGDPTRWAMAGMIAMAGLVTLRIVSLHATDALLYGPLHLNWFVDIGATLLVLAGAVRFRRLVKGPRRRGDR
jgi:hypothetical protein